jgi:hypothetical protein
MERTFLQSGTKTILLAGFVAGTLDILCAIFFLANGNAAGVLRFIAKGALGNAALEGGAEMILLGALFHYIIAFCFTVGYFVVFTYIPILKKQKILSGLLYGIFVWAVMQYLVLPLTHNPPGPVSFGNSWKSIVILMLAIGLPIALLIHKHYAIKQT